MAKKRGVKKKSSALPWIVGGLAGAGLLAAVTRGHSRGKGVHFSGGGGGGGGGGGFSSGASAWEGATRRAPSSHFRAEYTPPHRDAWHHKHWGGEGAYEKAKAAGHDAGYSGGGFDPKAHDADSWLGGYKKRQRHESSHDAGYRGTGYNPDAHDYEHYSKGRDKRWSEEDAARRKRSSNYWGDPGRSGSGRQSGSSSYQGQSTGSSHKSTAGRTYSMKDALRSNADARRMVGDAYRTNLAERLNGLSPEARRAVKIRFAAAHRKLVNHPIDKLSLGKLQAKLHRMSQGQQ